MHARYKHTQTGALVLTINAVVILSVLAIGFTSGWPPVILIVLLILVATTVIFSSLTVEVAEGVLSCRLGPGLIRKRFSLPEIREVQQVRNRWYYGWGIRLTPHGWMYAVSGLDAVEITLMSGKKFRIGTDEPEKLAAAVRAAMV